MKYRFYDKLNFGIFSSSRIPHFIIVISLIAILFSCNESFEPFQENDRFNFTVYGFLDASADTQWIRIAPVRGEFNMEPELPEMAITLQNMENGESTIMQDSLFDFRQGFNVINAWSDVEIKAAQTYRIIAEKTDGKQSEVTITLPEDFPTPRLFIERIPEQEPKYFLWIDGVDQLADVQSRWYYRVYTPYWEEYRMSVIPLKGDAVIESRGSYTVQMFPDEEQQQVMRESLVASHPDGNIEFIHHQLFIASGGPEWVDEISSIDDLVYYLPEGFTNVENGLGYMAGIVSKLIPFESCRDDDGQLIGCPLEKPYW